jgi:hypothetical protein
VFQGAACREPAGQQDLAALCSRPDRSVKLVQYRLRGKRLVASHALKDAGGNCGNLLVTCIAETESYSSFGPGRSMTEMIALPTKIIASKEKIACFAQMIATFARKTAQSCSMHRKPTTKPT